MTRPKLRRSATGVAPAQATELSEPGMVVIRRGSRGPLLRSSVDEPAPAVTALGMSHAAPHQAIVDLAGVAPASDRPPYRVPSMSEIRAGIGRTGLTVASTFSGCGGSCLGFEMAGYRVVYANEFIPAAAETYAANHPDVPLDTRSIRDVDVEAWARELGDVDVLEGSPPCASFSLAGKRQEGWGAERKYSDTTQRVDDLFEEYVRLLRALRPKVFVAENVAGLVRGVAVGYFKRIHASMIESGYRVQARMLDAQWLGVPQRRARVIFIGVRDDLERDPVFPKPWPFRYSIRDAIGDLVVAETRKVANKDVVPEDVAPTMKGYSVGREWAKLRPGETSKLYMNLARAHDDDPSPTVTAAGGGAMGAAGGVASVAHPSEPRKFTLAELKRLCSFPDDFVLTGTYAQQWERLGRAVPPLMMRAIAETIRDEVLNDAA